MKWVWTDEQLSDRDVQRLSALASELDLSAATTADTEREVMGDTKEAILERQEEATRQEERKPRQLDELYAQARTLYRDQKWQAVIDVFERIRAEDPGYPDPEGLTASARDALEAQERTREATGPYDEGQRHTDTEAVPQALDWVGILGQTWWALALRGPVFVIVGVIFWTNALALSSDYVKAGRVYGALMLVDGALALTTGIKIGRSGPRWLLIEGTISILAGSLAITIIPLVEPLRSRLPENWPFETPAFAILILWALAIGIIRVVAAMRLGRQVKNNWLLIVSGALAVIFGLLAWVVQFAFDDATKLPSAGIWALASGIVLTAFAFLARKRAGSELAE